MLGPSVGPTVGYLVLDRLPVPLDRARPPSRVPFPSGVGRGRGLWLEPVGVARGLARVHGTVITSSDHFE